MNRPPKEKARAGLRTPLELLGTSKYSATPIVLPTIKSFNGYPDFLLGRTCPAGNSGSVQREVRT